MVVGEQKVVRLHPGWFPQIPFLILKPVYLPLYLYVESQLRPPPAARRHRQGAPVPRSLCRARLPLSAVPRPPGPVPERCLPSWRGAAVQIHYVTNLEAGYHRAQRNLLRVVWTLTPSVSGAVMKAAEYL